MGLSKGLLYFFREAKNGSKSLRSLRQRGYNILIGFFKIKNFLKKIVNFSRVLTGTGSTGFLSMMR